MPFILRSQVKPGDLRNLDIPALFPLGTKPERPEWLPRLCAEHRMPNVGSIGMRDYRESQLVLAHQLWIGETYGC